MSGFLKNLFGSKPANNLDSAKIPDQGPHISGRELQKNLDSMVLAGLKPVLEGLAILFFLVSVINFFFEKEPSGLVLIISTFGTTLLILTVRVILEFWTPPSSFAHPITAFVTAVILTNIALDFYKTHLPQQTVNLILLMIAYGTIVLSANWFSLIMLLTFLVWLPIALIYGGGEEWVYYGFYFLAGTIIATVVHIVRVQNMGRIVYLRLVDEMRRAELEKALKETEAAKKTAEITSENLELAMQSVQQSEERFKRFSELTLEGIIIHDKEKILDYNSVFLKIFGWETRDVAQLTIADIISPEYREQAAIAAYSNYEKPFETVGLRKDGRTFPMEIYEKAIPYKNKTVKVSAIRDITERKKIENDIKEQLIFLQRLIDTIPNPVFFKDTNGIYLGLNEAFEKFLGLPKEQIIGKSVYELSPKDLADKYQEMDAELFKHPGTQTYETTVIDKDGTMRNIVFNKATFTHADGTLAGLVGVIVDITEEKKVQQILKEHTQELEVLNQIIVSGNFAKGLANLLEIILDSILKFMDFEVGLVYLTSPEKQAAEVRSSHSCPADFLEKFKEIQIKQTPFDRVFLNAQSVFTENLKEFFDDDAEKFGFSSLAIIPLFSWGRVIGSINIMSKRKHLFSEEEKKLFRAIGQNAGLAIDRMQVEEALRKSEEKYRELVESANSIILRMDRAGRILFFNEFAEKFFDYSQEEIMGQNVIGTILPDNETAHKSLEGMIAEIGRQPEKYIRGYATENIRRGGSHAWITWTNRAIFDGTGQVAEILCIGNDITERIELEKMKDEFVSTVSHEIRTPLSVVKESVSLVLEQIVGAISEKQARILTIARENTDRLSRIIDNLLDISKIEAGKMEVKKSWFTLNELVKKLEISFENKMKMKGLEFKTCFNKDEINIFADEDKIYQVLTNLVGNAIKFTDFGRIEVLVSDKGEEVECIIADTGRGIAEVDLPKLFNKFQQFGRGPGPGEKGTGLGLSIAKGIIEMHEGKIWAESQANQGTRFTFVLPKAGGAS